MSEQPDLLLRLIAWLVAQPEVQEFLRRTPRPDPDPAPPPAVPIDDPLFLTAHEVAKLLSVHPGRVYDMVRTKQLPAVRPGAHSIRISRHALMDWMSKGGSSGAEVPAAPLPPQPRQAAARTHRSRAASESPAPARHSQPAAPPRTTREPSPPVETPKLYTGIKQIAAQLGMPEFKVREYLRTNQMPYLKLGVRYVCTPRHLEEFIAHGMTEQAEGWDIYMKRLNWQSFSEKEQQEYIDAGFDPETLSFRDP